MVDRPTAVELYSHAAVFCCPSIYEPFGIINLEAMACGVPVVATAVGGIREVVVDGETGSLLTLRQQPEPSFVPVDPVGFSHALAGALNRLLVDPSLRQQMGRRGRARVEAQFSWQTVAQRTMSVYAALAAGLPVPAEVGVHSDA